MGRALSPAKEPLGSPTPPEQPVCEPGFRTGFAEAPFCKDFNQDPYRTLELSHHVEKASMALLSISLNALDIVVMIGIAIIGIAIALLINPPNAWVVKLTGKDRKDRSKKINS